MKTWGSFKYEIARIVNDPQVTKFSADLLDGVNDALRMLASAHTGVASVSEYVTDVSDFVGDTGTASFGIPANAVQGNEGLRIRGVYNVDTDLWLTHADIISGKKAQEGWLIWPDLTLRVNPKPTTGHTLQVHYVAYYNEVVDDTSIVIIPGWAYEAVKMYTAGRVINTQASQLALLASFRTKVDSGNPEHLPVLRLGQYYIQQFWDILAAHPAPQLEKLL
jgi:hypothetical protein